MPQRNYTYETCCIHSTAEKINALTSAAHEITRRTFLRYVDPQDRIAFERNLGYGHPKSRVDLKMANDWAVSYYRSTYDGRPCVYLVWSAIEHIFTPGDSSLV